jgi:hypothetical protein
MLLDAEDAAVEGSPRWMAKLSGENRIGATRARIGLNIRHH